MQELDLPEVFLEGGDPRYPSSTSCSLREMTLEILSRNDEWFFLFIPLSPLLGLVVQQIYSRQITGECKGGMGIDFFVEIAEALED